MILMTSQGGWWLVLVVQGPERNNEIKSAPSGVMVTAFLADLIYSQARLCCFGHALGRKSSRISPGPALLIVVVKVLAQSGLELARTMNLRSNHFNLSLFIDERIKLNFSCPY